MRQQHTYIHMRALIVCRLISTTIALLWPFKSRSLYFLYTRIRHHNILISFKSPKHTRYYYTRWLHDQWKNEKQKLIHNTVIWCYCKRGLYLGLQRPQTLPCLKVDPLQDLKRQQGDRRTRESWPIFCKVEPGVLWRVHEQIALWWTSLWCLWLWIWEGGRIWKAKQNCLCELVCIIFSRVNLSPCPTLPPLYVFIQKPH